MDSRQRADLDRYITGNYGEDQFKCLRCGAWHEDEEEDFVCEVPDVEEPDYE